MKRFAPFVGCALAALAASCASAVPEVVRAPRTGAVVLPAGGPSYFVFDAARVARQDDGATAWEEAHVQSGDPCAAGVDLAVGSGDEALAKKARGVLKKLTRRSFKTAAEWQDWW